MKNLLVVSVGFLLLFCAYNGLSNLQSTINSQSGLGPVSQAVLYGAFIVSAFFLPKMIIRKLGCKWTLVLAILTYCPYIAANFSPQTTTLIPTAVLLGLGAGPLWTSKSTYVVEIGRQRASQTNEPEDVVISRFFGIFFTFFQTTQIWGNLASYFVLRPWNDTHVDVSNESLAFCGIGFCPENSNNMTEPNLQPPSDQQRFILVCSYLACAILAAITIAVFLLPLERNTSEDEESNPVVSRLLATLKQMKKSTQIIIIPLTMFIGIQQAFFLGEFTRAYVACSWGVYHVGYMFICYGIVNSIVSLLCGRLLQYLPRLPMMTLAFLGNLTASVAMTSWEPNAEESYVFFVLAGVWGFSDAIWETQLSAFYGMLFAGNEEAAFSNHTLWTSLGSLISFAYSSLLCAAAKMYILLAFLVVGMSGYITLEIKEWKRERNSNVENTSIKDSDPILNTPSGEDADLLENLSAISNAPQNRTINV